MQATSEHTFVVCAYQESQHLEDCILSLLSQTLPTNIILYTSTPNKHIDYLSKKLSIPMYTGTAKGIGADWNQALSYVKTQYATIAHQDDIYLKNYIQTIMSLVSNNTVIAFSNYDEIDRYGNVRSRNINLKIKDLLLKPLQILDSNKLSKLISICFANSICCPAVTYNLNNLQDYKFNENLKVALDWEFWVRILQVNGAWVYTENNLIQHRIHNESETTSTINSGVRTLEELFIYEKLYPKILSKILSKIYALAHKQN